MFDDYVQKPVLTVSCICFHHCTMIQIYTIIYTYAENRYWYLYWQILLLQYLVLEVSVKIRIGAALL